MNLNAAQECFLASEVMRQCPSEFHPKLDTFPYFCGKTFGHGSGADIDSHSNRSNRGMNAPSPIPQRPQHRDVHSDCWPGPSKYARCCVRLDAACFDGVLTHERCCGEAKQAKRVSWWGGQEIRSFAHLALLVIQQRLGCFPSASLDMASCCGSPASTHLGFDCWDGGFSRKHCCGHLSELSQIPLKPSECFLGSDYTFEKCCSTRDAGILLGCWDFRFSYEKCCVNQGAEAVSLVSVNNLTALLAAKSRGMCDRGLTLRHCQRHWRQVVAGVPALVSNKVGRYARHLAEYWRSRNLLEDVAQAAPGFAVSIALHAAAYILAEWRGGLHEPYFAFQHVATYLKLYRENVGRVDLKDMTSQAGGLRLADLDEAISILVQQSFPTSLDVAQRERIIDLHTHHPRALATATTHAAFQGSLAEAIEALDSLQLDYVPSQGTLISLLRYGDFPAGRLSNSKDQANAASDIWICAVVGCCRQGCQSSRQDLGLGCLTGHGSHVPVKMAAVAGAAGGLDTSVKVHNAAIASCKINSSWGHALALLVQIRSAGLELSVVRSDAPHGEYDLARSSTLSPDSQQDGSTQESMMRDRAGGYHATLSCFRRPSHWQLQLELVRGLWLSGLQPNQLSLNAALKVRSSASQWQSALQQGGMAACAGIQENAATRTTLTSILRDVQRWQRVLLRFSRLWRSVSFDEIELRTVVGAVSRERSAWALVNALLCALQQDLLEPSSGLISSVLVNRDCWEVAILSSRSTNLILRTAVVGLCARTGQWTRSLSHAWQMRDIKLSLNDRTLVAAITAWKAGKRWLDAIGMLGTLSSGGSLANCGSQQHPLHCSDECLRDLHCLVGSGKPTPVTCRPPRAGIERYLQCCHMCPTQKWRVVTECCLAGMHEGDGLPTGYDDLLHLADWGRSARLELCKPALQFHAVNRSQKHLFAVAAVCRSCTLAHYVRLAWQTMGEAYSTAASIILFTPARDVSEEQAGQLVDLGAEASWRLGAAMVVEAASFSLRPNLMTSTPVLAVAGRTGDWQMSLVFLAEASDTVDSVANCAAATACTASTYWSYALGLLCSVPCTRLPLDTAGESATAMALEAGSAWQLLIQQIGQAAWLRGDIGFCCSVSGACEKASKWAMALWMATNFHWLRVSERIACNSCLTSCRRSGCWELTLRRWIGFEDGFQDILTLALGVDLLDKWDVVDNDAELMVFLEGTFWRDEGARISLELQARDWPPCLLQFYRKLVCISMSHGYPVKLEFYFFGKDLASGTISNSPDKEDVGRYPLQAWGGQMPMDIVYPFTTCRLGETGRPVKCPAKAMDLLYHWNSVEGVGEYVRDSRDALANMPGKNGLPKEDWCIALPVVTQDRDFSDPRNSRLIEQGLNAEDLRLLEGYADVLHRDGYASFAKHLQDGSCQRRQDSILRGDQFVGLAAGGGKVRDDNHPGFG
eukprot:s5110_g4.t11